MNTYAYVGSNPLYWIDPLGLSGVVPNNHFNKWNNGQNSTYPPTFRCKLYDNCMSDGDKTGYEWVDNTICDIMPGKNPKIGDFEIPLDIPGKACQQVNKSIKCTQDCWGLCNGD